MDCKLNTQNMYIIHMDKFKDMIQNTRTFGLPFELKSLRSILELFFFSLFHFSPTDHMPFFLNYIP